MSLQLLHASSSLHLFYDTDRDWLYLDWQGALTLPAVQAGWLELARCLLARPYACLLNSNAQVTRIDYAVRPWLLRGFAQFLQLSGTRQLAWVYAPTGPGFGFAESVATTLPPTGCSLALFADEEQAVSWLEHYAAEARLPRSHPAEALSRLRRLVQALEQRLADQLMPVHRAPAGRTAKPAGPAWLSFG